MLQRILEELARTRRLHLRGVSRNARPWLAAALARAQAGPLLWITAEERDAEEACAAARFFAGDSDPDPSDPFAAQVALFPLHQSLPYEDLSPDREALAERLSVLFRLVHGAPPRLLVSGVISLLRLGIPRKAVDEGSVLILRGQEIDRELLARDLVRTGYLNVPMVEDTGTFAIRGGILDIFGPQLPLPVRIELLGNEVESIRTFDVASQRTVRRLDSFYIGPVREIYQDPAGVRKALEEIDRLADAQDVTSSRWLALRRALKEGVRFFGIESFLPAFYPSLESLFDYLPSDTIVLIEEPGAVLAAAEEHRQRAQTAYQAAREAGNLAFSPEQMLLSAEALKGFSERHRFLSVGLAEETENTVEMRTDDIAGLRQDIRSAAIGSQPLAPLTDLLTKWRHGGIRPFLVASRPGRALQLAQMLRQRGLAVRVEEGVFDPGWMDQPTPSLGARLVRGDIPGGFVAPAAGLGFLPDAEIFGRPIQRPRGQAAEREQLSLKNGDLVVHSDFGIGRFEGLTRLQAGGSEGDFLLLRYRDDDRLYLPVTRMNLVERYHGPEGAIPLLSKLGGTAWERTKQRVHQALLEMADELVRLDATRRAQPGMPIEVPGDSYQDLEASFPFEETEDQQRAIREVIEDLVKPRAMDRLVCGDVGFGKTEVAVRAAFLKALAQQQTAVLVPTTILALQHLATFRARLEQQALRVEMISRLVPAPQQKAILADLGAGRVDIIIGTHRLLRDDVGFKSLGLVVIDEEHRFGVRHKERLKQLKKNIDVLTMTATPLPRTLQMSLLGLRDISVIQTPPPGRRSIRTFIMRFSTRVIVEAIRRERARGGQVFFVHNWARSLPAMERFLHRVVPEARTAIAHGQMPERKLEQVMTDFVRREIDVLVCTSIIESGLDIPSANTILINRADMFGLAQLYQIRGRVGRSGERAYAYFLIPGIEAITPDARKRLEVLADHSELGSGYRVAAQDLELRGAGNILGKAQSGQIGAVGFELYSRLLERAVMEVRGQATAGSPDPEVNLPVAGFLPEDYIPDQDQRLDLYARISRAADQDQLGELERELVDRFGPVPPEVSNLLEIMFIKMQLRRLGALTLEFKGGILQLRLAETSDLAPERLVEMVKQRADRLSLDPAGWLRLKLDEEERTDLLPAVHSFLATMMPLIERTVR